MVWYNLAMAKKQASVDDVLVVISDLSDMISERFDQHDARFDQHDARFDQHDARFDKLGKDVNQIYNILDAHMKRIEEILQENTMRDHQPARMERWIF